MDGTPRSAAAEDVYFPAPVPATMGAKTKKKREGTAMGGYGCSGELTTHPGGDNNSGNDGDGSSGDGAG